MNIHDGVGELRFFRFSKDPLREQEWKNGGQSAREGERKREKWRKSVWGRERKEVKCCTTVNARVRSVSYADAIMHPFSRSWARSRHKLSMEIEIWSVNLKNFLIGTDIIVAHKVSVVRGTKIKNKKEYVDAHDHRCKSSFMRLPSWAICVPLSLSSFSISRSFFSSVNMPSVSR